LVDVYPFKASEAEAKGFQEFGRLQYRSYNGRERGKYDERVRLSPRVDGGHRFGVICVLPWTFENSTVRIPPDSKELFIITARNTDALQ